MLKKYPAAEYAEGPGMRPAPVGLCQNVSYQNLLKSLKSFL